MSKDRLLLETIKIEDGKIDNLFYHQKRFDKSRQLLFQVENTIDLNTLIITPKQGLYRCRIIYGKHIHSIEYIPYTPKKVHRINIVSSSLDYSYKYANREALNSLLSTQDNANDILIEKNGFITDTSIANIAFYKEDQWITPALPLLEGTMREKLLDEGFLKKENITIDNLEKYSQVALMNAMLGFKILNDVTIIDTKGKHYDY